MKKYIILILALFVSEVKAQSSEHIIYDLPENVSQEAKEYIEEYISNNDSTLFIAELYRNKDYNYVLSLIVYDFKGLESFKLLDEEIIKKTNRIVRISESYLLPLITEADLEFAYLGSVPARNDKQGKKKVLFNHESYSIIFDRSGKIYKN